MIIILSGNQTLHETRGDSDGDIAGDGYTFQPRPLDKTIQQIIRPRSIRPHVR